MDRVPFQHTPLPAYLPACLQVSEVLERSIVQTLLQPIKELVALVNSDVWAEAQTSLVLVPVRAQTLAAQLGLADGKVLLQGSRGGPASLQVSRYGPALEALIRADLAEVSRYSSLSRTARGLLGLIVQGLQVRCWAEGHGYRREVASAWCATADHHCL